MECDKLWKILEAIQTQIRAFDAKAQIVLGIDGILAGFLGTQAAKLASASAIHGHCVMVCLLVLSAVLCLVLLGCSFLWALRTIHPMLNLGQPKSRLFFTNIVETYGKDYKRAQAEYSEMTDEQLSADIGGQVLANSIICQTKAVRFRKGLFAMAFGLAFWAATLIFQFSLEHSIVKEQQAPKSATPTSEKI